MKKANKKNPEKKYSSMEVKNTTKYSFNSLFV